MKLLRFLCSLLFVASGNLLAMEKDNEYFCDDVLANSQALYPKKVVDSKNKDSFGIVLKSDNPKSIYKDKDISFEFWNASAQDPVYVRFGLFDSWAVNQDGDSLMALAPGDRAYSENPVEQFVYTKNPVINSLDDYSYYVVDNNKVPHPRKNKKINPKVFVQYQKSADQEKFGPQVGKANRGGITLLPKFVAKQARKAMPATEGLLTQTESGLSLKGLVAINDKHKERAMFKLPYLYKNDADKQDLAQGVKETIKKLFTLKEMYLAGTCESDSFSGHIKSLKYASTFFNGDGSNAQDRLILNYLKSDQFNAALGRVVEKEKSEEGSEEESDEIIREFKKLAKKQK